MAHTFRNNSDYDPHPSHRVDGRVIGKAVSKATRGLSTLSPIRRHIPRGEVAAWLAAQEMGSDGYEGPDALDQVTAQEAERESVLKYRALDDPQILAMHRRERRLQAAEDIGRAIVLNSQR